MKSKDFLGSIQRIDARLEHLEEELETLESEATSISGANYGDKVQISPATGARYEKRVARAEELREEIEEERRRKVEERHHIIKMIDSLSNPTFSRLLHLRYVDGLDFDRVADRLGYSYKHVIRMHGWALQAFEEVIKDDDGNVGDLTDRMRDVDGRGRDDGGDHGTGVPGSEGGEEGGRG